MDMETPSWLNIDFTERILRLSENDSTLQVIDVFVKPATGKGDNYCSDMMRVSVEYTRMQGDKRAIQKKWIIFKTEPIAERIGQAAFGGVGLFDTEISMMTDTLKKMSEMLGHDKRLAAEIYHVRMERPLCLVMEDLAASGFVMADRLVGLDLEHCLLAIRGLARFHASSVALCEKEPIQKTMYNKGILCDDYPDGFKMFFTQGCVSLANEVEKWPELGKTYADKLRALVDRIYSIGFDSIKRRDDEFNVINHGDFWVNNMLFKYDENSKPIEHIFVDFQICIHTTPAVDLLYFLNTSPSVDVYDNHMDDLMVEYLHTLTSTMKQLNCVTPPPTMDDIKRTMEERAVFAFIISMNILPFVLLDKSKVVNSDQELSADTYDSSGYRSAVYKNRMIKRLPKFNDMGLLDL